MDLRKWQEGATSKTSANEEPPVFQPSNENPDQTGQGFQPYSQTLEHFGLGGQQPEVSAVGEFPDKPDFTKGWTTLEAESAGDEESALPRNEINGIPIDESVPPYYSTNSIR